MNPEHQQKLVTEAVVTLRGSHLILGRSEDPTSLSIALDDAQAKTMASALRYLAPPGTESSGEIGQKQMKITLSGSKLTLSKLEEKVSIDLSEQATQVRIGLERIMATPAEIPQLQQEYFFHRSRGAQVAAIGDLMQAKKTNQKFYDDALQRCADRGLSADIVAELRQAITPMDLACGVNVLFKAVVARMDLKVAFAVTPNYAIGLHEFNFELSPEIKLPETLAIERNSKNDLRRFANQDVGHRKLRISAPALSDLLLITAGELIRDPLDDRPHQLAGEATLMILEGEQLEDSILSKGRVIQIEEGKRLEALNDLSLNELAVHCGVPVLKDSESVNAWIQLMQDNTPESPSDSDVRKAIEDMKVEVSNNFTRRIVALVSEFDKSSYRDVAFPGSEKVYSRALDENTLQSPSTQKAIVEALLNESEVNSKGELLNVLQGHVATSRARLIQFEEHKRDPAVIHFIAKEKEILKQREYYIKCLKLNP